LKNIPLIEEGDNISEIILQALKKNNLALEDGDIIVIAQTIISKSSGQIKNLNDITPSDKALDLYKTIKPKAKTQGLPIKNPELIQIILDESKEIIHAEHVLITETKHGFVCANAGIDKSNVNGKENVSLLPKNSDKEAEKIRNSLKKITNKDVAIIISDSFGRPFRIGSVGVALGISGMSPILDKRGEKDLFGYTLQTTIVGQADNLASAAQLVMGETNEGIPIVIIRGYNFELKYHTSITPILREKQIDLFRVRNLEQILRNRRSYKVQFKEKKVDESLIEKCIDLARWAPSAHNGQFWRYVIIEKGIIREKLIEKMNNKLERDLIKDGKSKEFIEKKKNKTKDRFYKAPILILLCLDKKDLEIYPDLERNQNEFVLGVQSISCSATYLLLAFELEKLAACWYCAPLFAKEVVRDALKLPESYIPMAFFTVGYPNKTLNAPARKNLSEIVYKPKI